MNPPPFDAGALAALVADGRAVDWERLEASSGEGARKLLRQFRTLDSLGRARLVPERAAGRTLADRLRAWLTPVFWIAALRVGISVLGYLAVGSQHTDVIPLELKLAAALTFVAAGLFLAYGGARDPRALDLAGFYLVVASSFTVRPLVELAALAGPGLHGLAQALRAVPTDAFMALLFWMFVLRFPDLAAYTAPQRVARAFVRVSAALGAFLFLANLPVWPRSLAAVPASFDRDNPNYLFSVTQMALSLAAVPVALWKARLAEDDERRRVSLFLVALGIGAAPMMIASVLTLPVFGVREWLLARQAEVGVYLFAFLLTIPLTTAWAVRVHRVLDVRLLARKALRYAFARHSLAFLAVAPVLLLALQLYRHRSETVAEALSSPPAAALLALSLVSGLLWRLRDAALARLDRLFSRSHDQPAVILARFERALQQGRGPLAVAQSVFAEATRAFQPETAAVLLLDAPTQRFVTLAGGLRALEADSALAHVLADEPTALALDLEERGHFAHLLPESDRQWIADGAVRLVAPILDVGGTLRGLLALGARRSELPYSDSDVAVIAAITTAAASALERERETAVAASPDAPPEFAAHECTACGLVASADAPPCACGVALQPCLLPGLVAQKFALEARAGAGGMGVVYRARDLTLDRAVALKTLPRASAEFAARLRREARTMASVSHPNLALIYGAESWRGVPFLVVEFLHGGTLRDRLKRSPLPADEAVALGLQMLEVLERLHARGVLHRDIKPSNIGFTADGVAKLLDFGLARLVDDGELPPPVDEAARAAAESGSELSSGGHWVGTPLYMPAEAFAGALPSPAWDLWSLAVVLHEAIGGAHPLRGGPVIPSLAALVPSIDPRLSALLAAALHPNPRRRPASAADFRRDLAALAVRS